MEPALAQNAVAWPLAGGGLASFGATDLDLTIRRRSRQLPAGAMQHIDEIHDTGNELTAASGERLAEPRTPESLPGWVTAIGVSGTLHAALAAALLIAPVAALGSFQDAVDAEGADKAGANVVGSVSDSGLPGSINVSLVQAPRPAKPRAVAPQSQAAVTMPPAEPPAQSPEPAAKPAAEAESDLLMAGTPRHDSDSVPVPATQPASTERADSSPAFMGEPPLPTPRPASAEGSEEANRSLTARGTADGQEIKAPVASKGRKKAASGDAIRSRYSGEIASKLARANRLVSRAAQTEARNNATVSFVVLANGSVTNLKLARSSGSPELDQFALNLVREQAPFPPIPPETGLSSWAFRAPVGPY